MQRSELLEIRDALKEKGEHALDAAFRLLGIEKNTYANIPSSKIKKEFLLYKYLFAEFKFCKEEYSEGAVELQKMTDDAYQIISATAITASINTSYGTHSYGLSELGLRTIRNAPSLEQSVIKIDEKKGGVEPGFEAIHVKDVLLHIYKLHPTKGERVKLIRDCHTDILELHGKFKDHLPKYMVKLDYEEKKDGRVVVKDEDLKKTKTLQDIYEKGEWIGDVVCFVYRISKSTTVTGKNCEAVLEVVANDIARLFMTVQNQTLYQDQYDDGTLKLMLKAAWITGAKTLAPIAGGKDRNNNNYCVEPVILPVGGVAHLASCSINRLAEKLPILIIQNDRDAIGSSGQNKLRKGNEVVAIDFGHAYQESASDLIKNLTADFRIKNSDFKNYSIFYDSKRSDIVRGLIKLAAFSGLKLSSTVLESYGSEFAGEIKSIKPKDDEKIFDDYILKFGEMRSQYLISGDMKENIECCDKIIETLQEAKKRHIQDRGALINDKRFNSNLSLECNAIDLLENLEKISSPKDNISLRSIDGTVLLNHLRIQDPEKAKWDVALSKEGEYCYFKKFTSKKSAEAACKAIKTLLPQKTDLNWLNINLVNGNEVNLKFSEKYLANVLNFYKEERVKEDLFPDDYQLFLQYKAEQSLVNLLKVLSAYNVKAELKADDGKYKLLLSPITEDGIDPSFSKSFREGMGKIGIELDDNYSQISSSFGHGQVKKLAAMLDNLPEVKLIVEQQSRLIEFCQALQKNPVVNKNFTMLLYPFESGVKLELKNNDPTSMGAKRIEELFRLTVSKFKTDSKGEQYIIPFKSIEKLNEGLSDTLSICNSMNTLGSSVSSSLFSPVAAKDKSSQSVSITPDKSS